MLGGLGMGELLVILLIVIILFGIGRVSRLGGELGEAIGNFRRGVQSATDDDEKSKNEA
ncbi:MAG: twin-arginine translocase TatA/TatE family subunit [Chloroflexota bacterium]